MQSFLTTNIKSQLNMITFDYVYRFPKKFFDCTLYGATSFEEIQNFMQQHKLDDDEYVRSLVPSYPDLN